MDLYGSIIMTEKRFTLEEFGLNFIVNDNGRNLTAKQTVDRLNELNDETEQLKNKIKHYDEVWVNQLKEELRSIESRLGFIHPVLSHDPVLTRFTAPLFSEKTALLERRIEIKKILKEFDLE